MAYIHEKGIVFTRVNFHALPSTNVVGVLWLVSRAPTRPAVSKTLTRRTHYNKQRDSPQLPAQRFQISNKLQHRQQNLL